MPYYRTTGGAALLGFARQLTGVPYRYGGTAPGPCDCSSLIEWSAAQIGVQLVRTSEGQYTEYEYNNRNLPSEPGDILFIRGDPIDANPGHEMIYVSEGRVFQALETGTRIGEFDADTENWEFRTRPALGLGFAPVVTPPKAMPQAKGTPTAAQLKQTSLVKLPNVTAAELAVKNGWALWYFSENHDPPFVAQVGGEPTGVVLYANAAYKGKKAA